MTLSIPYPELSRFLWKQIGKEFTMSYKSDNRITVTYTITADIPIVHIPVQKKVSFDLEIAGLTGTNLTFAIDAGTLANFTLKHLADNILSFLPIKVSTCEFERIYTIDLQDIPQLEPILNKITIESISAYRDSITILATLNI